MLIAFAHRLTQEWQQQEASISKLESQQRRLKHQISLLGPKQQQQVQSQNHQEREKRMSAHQPSPEELVGGMPRSGWVIRQIEDRYRLHKKLKGGAMAVVYLAEDKAVSSFYHEVVLKVLYAGGTFEQRQRQIFFLCCVLPFVKFPRCGRQESVL